MFKFKELIEKNSDEIAKMPLVEGKLKSPDLNQNIPLEQA